MRKTTAIALFATLLAFRCAKAEAPAAQKTAPVTASSRTGRIVETFDAGGYTYLRLQTASGETWAAVRQTKVKTGQTVTLLAQMTAEKFHSSTLDRTFDTIVFGTLGEPQESAPQNAGVIARAEGANGYTVAELWAQRTSLQDRPVVVRGKVVKFLAGIMGRNWIHLRDGSGSAEKGDHDITVTTSATAAVGETVVAAGVLRADKDFGAGYQYGAIVEDAEIRK